MRKVSKGEEGYVTVADGHLDLGLVQVYTGDGKGKTTAALGQALRAVGRGLKVYMAQFIKGQETGELLVAKRLAPDFVIRQFGLGKFITGREPSSEELEMAKAGWAEITRVADSGEYDIVILDEISHAIRVGLIRIEQVLELLDRRPKQLEVILTGRRMPGELTEVADLRFIKGCLRIVTIGGYPNNVILQA
jgi:cob(I)alamin adenosyltransferase